MWLTKLFKRKEKVEDSKPISKDPKIVRVYSHDDLDLVTAGFSYWSSDYYDKPHIIKKIHEHLKSAKEILVYVSTYGIEYSAWTKTKGQVNGSCHHMDYEFFTFGIRKAGVRYDIAGADRSHPDVKAFYDWIDSIFGPLVEEFKRDRNL